MTRFEVQTLTDTVDRFPHADEVVTIGYSLVLMHDDGGAVDFGFFDTYAEAKAAREELAQELFADRYPDKRSTDLIAAYGRSK